MQRRFSSIYERLSGDIRIKESTMKILFASDLGFRYFDVYHGNEYIERVFSDLLPTFKAADFRMLNFETPFAKDDFTPIVKSGPNTRALPEYIYALDVMGIDAVALANNHTGDFGDDGARFVLEHLHSNGYPTLGAGENIDEAYVPHAFEKNGERVLVLSVCENEFGVAEKDKPGAAGYSLGRVAKFIKNAKAEGCYAVVYFHGGNEDNPYPSPMKKELYRHFIDLGADSVVAMHTHCPQGYEIYEEKPIIYSMGNFYYTSARLVKEGKESAFRYGYMTELDFSGGKVSFVLHPYEFDLEKIELLRGERLEKFNDYLAEISAPIADDEELRRYFDGWALVGGKVYAGMAVYTPEMEEDIAAVVHMKNDFSCEAHAEVVKAYLNLCYKGKEALEQAEEYKKKLLEKTKIYL